MARILITGVGGFIGSNLARTAIAAGHEVIGIDSFVQGIAENVPHETTLHTADICSSDIYPLFDGVDVVFHLAAKNSLSDCQKDPVGTMHINVTGTANVFEASLRAKVKKVVYAQSSVLEEGDDRLTGFYAISKLAGTHLASGYNALGLTTVGARYFNVYGPGQDYRRSRPPVMSRFIIDLLRGNTPVVFENDAENKRDFIHVDDVNAFHLLCIDDARVDNTMFRIGSGVSTSMVEALEIVQRVLGTSVVPRIEPRLPGDEPVQTRADITDTRALGWEPKVQLTEGIGTMVAYIRAEMEAGRIV